jgi:phage tail-like protein
VQADRIQRLLPEVYQTATQPDSVLSAILRIMETLHAPSEAALSDLDSAFDPHRAQDAFVTMLACWVTLGPLVEAAGVSAGGQRRRMMVEAANLRELTARAATLARAPGTLASLKTFLELATGLQGFRIDNTPPDLGGRPLPFSATLTVPPVSGQTREIIELIVAREKPAFTRVAIIYEPG